MADGKSVVVIGGTSGIGREVARFFADRGCDVTLSGREAGRAKDVASGLGGRARGIAMDLAETGEIAARLADVGHVDHLVLAAIERDENTAREYDIARATRLATLKLVGYTEVIHALLGRMGGDSSMVLFGGQAKDRPYKGSMTVTTVNGGIEAMVRALAVELAPIRVNAIHPGIVGDSPYWREKGDKVLEPIRARTPTGRLVTMQDVVGAVVFLLENRSMNGADLRIDGGTLLL
jgi:NAD(P)-dependent dehydrogenase (short-subunit alcohol dehydrogenase family)